MADLVAEPSEEELPRERAAERDPGDGGRHAGREGSGVLGAGLRVVDAPEELGDKRDAEQVVGVGEEAHAGDDDRHEMVPLRLGLVEGGQDVELTSRHYCSNKKLSIASRLLAIVLVLQLQDLLDAFFSRHN